MHSNTLDFKQPFFMSCTSEQVASVNISEPDGVCVDLKARVVRRDLLPAESCGVHQQAMLDIV